LWQWGINQIKFLNNIKQKNMNKVFFLCFAISLFYSCSVSRIEDGTPCTFDYQKSILADYPVIYYHEQVGYTASYFQRTIKEFSTHKGTVKQTTDGITIEIKDSVSQQIIGKEYFKGKTIKTVKNKWKLSTIKLVKKYQKPILIRFKI
jgi:hypothetical protein